MSNSAAQAAPESTAADQPATKGLALYKDNYLGFSFFHPEEWHQFNWLDGRRGVLYGPVFNDNSTIFAVAVQDLGIRVNTRDLKDLHMGFISGIGRLANSQIEWQNQWQSGDQIGMEARYSFIEGDAKRKRWVRVLYQDTRQFTLTVQVAHAAEFDEWLPMFHQSMMTFRIQVAPLYKQRPVKPKLADAPKTESAPPLDNPSDDSGESTS
ncbi:MAG: hypothetical protein KF893_14365 [Caldilineaceae bacterium]|nr:hypothetical protein [Caldilineaceae bacterium]